jgi:hypothetical protein
MTELEYFEARRYSAVLVDDPRVTSVGTVARAWGLHGKSVRSIEGFGWSVTRLTYGSRKNHYPPSVRVTKHGEGHPHEIYLATPPRDSGFSGMLIAAPYVRLLRESIGRLDANLEGDAALAFSAPDMNALFAHFETSTHRHMRASHIEVKMRDNGLDHVALSGRNPLRSDLRHALLQVARPYAIRVRTDSVRDMRPTNVNLDQHGNIWWHLSGESAWGNVLPVLQLLIDEFELGVTHDLPLLKLSDRA